ncbi:MAG: HEAT repeat domain-containing protein [Planctomycetaceae bacterium]
MILSILLAVEAVRARPDGDEDERVEEAKQLKALLGRTEKECFLSFDRLASTVRARDGDHGQLLEQLLELVEDPYSIEGEAAAIALARLGGGGIDALVRRLDGEEETTRWRAADGLLHGAAEAAVPALCAALQGTDAPRALAAVRTLAQFGPLASDAVPHLKALLDGDSALRVEATLALARIGYADDRVCALIVEGLQASDWDRKMELLAGIASLGPAAGACTEFLADAIRQGPLEDRILHARALWAVRGRAEEVLPLYLEGLRSDDEETLEQATRAISRLGQEGRKGALRLIDLWIAQPRDFSLAYLHSYGSAIDEIGLTQHDLLAIEARMKAGEPIPADRYADLLSVADAPSAFLLPRIVKALDGFDSGGRHNLLSSLRYNSRIYASLVPRLTRYVGDWHEGLSWTAGAAIADLGPLGVAAVPALRRYVKDPDHAARDLCVAVLGAIGERAREAIPDVIAALESGEAWVALEAAVTLGRLVPLPGNAVEALRAARARDSGAVAIACADSLFRNDPRDRDALMQVVRALEDERTLDTAVRLLQEHGVEAREALPALERLIDASLYELAVLAARAARAVGGDPMRTLDKATRMFVMEMEAGCEVTMPAYLSLVREMGSLAREVHPLLRRYLREFHRDSDSRKSIRRILGA